MSKHYCCLENISDETLFDETAKRLLRLYRKECGVTLYFGAFEFVIEGGVFRKITKPISRTLYTDPSRLKTVPRICAFEAPGCSSRF